MGEDGASPDSQQSTPDAAARRAATKRFNEAVTSLSSNSDDDLWVQLNSMYIDDSKAQKLCDALQKNTHVISIDLTGNDLSDAGVHALCNVLATGAAPDLITLRLQDNPGISKEGIDAIHELIKTRKSIKIETGTSPKPTSPSSTSNKTNNNTLAGNNATNQSLGNSDFVRKYFQVGNDDDDGDDPDGDGGGGANGGGNGEEGALGGMDPEQLSALLWDKVRH